MNSMQTERLVTLHQMDHVAGTADAGHYHIVGLRYFVFGHVPFEGPLDRPSHTEIPTSRAPNEVVFRVAFAHAATIPFSVRSSATRAAIRFTSVAGLNGSPVYCVTDSAR